MSLGTRSPHHYCHLDGGLPWGDPSVANKFRRPSSSASPALAQGEFPKSDAAVPARVGAVWDHMPVFVYVDESFDEQEFWVTGLIVPEEQAIALETALDRVVQKAADAYGVSPRAELHGNDLMNGKKDWVALDGKFRARFGVFLEALDAIAVIPGIRAFAFGVDRVAQERKYVNPLPPRQVLIGHLAQRCHRLLGKGQALALFVDESPKQADIRAHVRDFKKNGTWSKYDRRPLTKILDTVYFAPSCESRLLQAADIVSYAHFRARRTPQTSRSYAAGKQAWLLVEELCDCNFWVP